MRKPQRLGKEDLKGNHFFKREMRNDVIRIHLSDLKAALDHDWAGAEDVPDWVTEAARESCEYADGTWYWSIAKMIFKDYVIMYG